MIGVTTTKEIPKITASWLGDREALKNMK